VLSSYYEQLVGFKMVVSAAEAAQQGANTTDGTEWPTILLACCIYAGWGLLTFFHAWLPWWALFPMGAWIIAWHMSLQHEVLHGHPTRHRLINDAIGFPPLAVWLPYGRYRTQHLRHHCGSSLTDPIDDPESYYITSDRLRLAPAPLLLLWRFRNTLLGRLSLGPALCIVGFLRAELRLARHDPAIRRTWAWHGAGVLALLAWLMLVCRMSLVQYAVLFVYPGCALAMLRSFAEHRAAKAYEHRTAIVEAAPALGLLFLYNNLHVVHHLRPGLSWYRIPAFYRAQRDNILRLNGGLVYRGYWDIVRRYLLRPHDRLDNGFTR
jgi:fatty acid desaturase